MKIGEVQKVRYIGTNDFSFGKLIVAKANVFLSQTPILDIFKDTKKLMWTFIISNYEFSLSQKNFQKSDLSVIKPVCFWLRLRLLFFPSFTNSLSCGLFLQFYIKIDTFYTILVMYHVRIQLYYHQFSKQNRFCEILKFLLLTRKLHVKINWMN